MEKIAVPTQNGYVDDHFGQCDYFTVFTLQNGEIINTEKIESPHGCGCKSNIAQQLHVLGVTKMLAGNMGNGARDKITQSGIKVYLGCNGLAEDVVKAYVAGKITDAGVECKMHDGKHECRHIDKK